MCFGPKVGKSEEKCTLFGAFLRKSREKLVKIVVKFAPFACLVGGLDIKLASFCIFLYLPTHERRVTAGK